MSVLERTHDFSLTGKHVKDLDSLLKILNQSLLAAFPRASGSRYSDVNVLLLSWEDDDLDVVTEITELSTVFSQVYGYETDHYRIPSTQSHIALARKILESLLASDSSEKLLIVYYGGHGYMNDQRDCVWLCNQRPDAPTVQWSSIQTTLGQADSDVLILLDCCAAASSVGVSSKGHTEVMGACGFETGTPGVGDHSFTRSLIEELRYYGEGKRPVSTAFLYSKVLARAKNSWNPRFERDADRERRKTPVHIHLADRSKQRCIELVPMRIPPASNSSPSVGSPSQVLSAVESPAHSTPPSEDVDMSDAADSNQTPSSESLAGLQKQLPRVLISVALELEQVFRIEDWMDWLKSFPALAQCILLESIYQSDSQLLIFSVPIALWDMLPKDPAIAFVAFVRSGNLLTSKAPPIENQETEASMHKTLIAPITESSMKDDRVVNVNTSSWWKIFKREPHSSFMIKHGSPKRSISLSKASVGWASGLRSSDQNASSKSLSTAQFGPKFGYGSPNWSPPETIIPIVIHLYEGKHTTVLAVLDTVAEVNVINMGLLESSGLKKEEYTGASLASPLGVSLRPEWQTTVDWHVKGFRKTDTSTFVLLDRELCEDFDILIGKLTLEEVGFYSQNKSM
ncbi:MAG: hypothetical protein Q9223_005443 [Gallowayella weberi]